MRRPLPAWLLCAALLAGGTGFAQLHPGNVPGPGKLVVATSPVPPPPPPAVETEVGTEEQAAEAIAPEEEAVADEAAASVEKASVDDESEGPQRFGYADTTGNLENLEDTDGLRVSIRSGSLRAKRGYTPLEVTLHNTENAPRQMRLSLQGYSSGSPTTERELELGPRQRLTTYLLIPAPVQSGLFNVSGPSIRPRGNGVYLDEGSSLSSLVLGTSKAFEAGTGIPRAEDRKPPELNIRFVPVQDAPRELAAYVGYPVVMVMEEVATVPADVWAALENYAAAGGSLILARPPRDVHQRLPLLSPEPERDAWNGYGFGDVYLCQSGSQDCGKAMLAVEQDGRLPLDPIGPPPRWENNRFALNGGETPLLPNALVPVGRFLVLIFLFSLVVGPGGLMLARRKGPVALLIGVPSVALITCLIIIADSVLVDGFVTHSSRYSYTFLDRPRDRAVTAGVGGYYANLAAGTMRFPANSVLLAPDEMNDWFVDVSWTGGGMEAEGFLPARNYLEWGELAVVPTRARLAVRREGAVVKVQNALGAPLQAGSLQLGKKRYSLPELADGAEGVATELQGEAGTSIVHPPMSMTRRTRERRPGFQLPLRDGEFVAQLRGLGFGPLAVLKVELHEGIHYVRGQVDTP
ncbi:hypothetical protein [Hyalangium sp.]|uniref:hypothetical protein n=1 Tax=Hyalangium sp. TaxID=2028555 RepID=UPI002D5205B4|nr:hypothetical protein [Hyalangium sp.]HYI02476.1 hypothetical protein [Hyalangium sp.]